MPILVQWKWMERTRSFLVIFHFFDDGQKPNLRIRMKRHHKMIVNEEGMSEFVKKYPDAIPEMTWAPSHVELGCLGELLRYANIIGGLKEFEKRKLIPKLQGDTRIDHETEDLIWDFDKELIASMPSHSSYLWLIEDQLSICFEVCIEYIDYLKKLLEPYLK